MTKQKNSVSSVPCYLERLWALVRKHRNLFSPKIKNPDFPKTVSLTKQFWFLQHQWSAPQHNESVEELKPAHIKAAEETVHKPGNLTTGQNKTEQTDEQFWETKQGKKQTMCTLGKYKHRSDDI